MDAISGAFDFALAAQAGAVVGHFHEAACGHFGPVQAERNLIVAVVVAGHAQGEMVENPFIQAMHDGQPVRGGQIDTRLPALRGQIEILRLQ